MLNFLSQKYRQTSVFALMVLILIGGARLASADAPDSQPDSVTTISGSVSFEKHHLLNPLSFCNQDGCSHPKPYWALVVESGTSKYILNKPFDEGTETAPEFIEVNSVVLRPGAHVEIQARVDVVSRDYAVFSDIQRINVVMDASNVASAPFFGWTCHSVGETHPVYVDVMQVSRNGDYSMRVLGSNGDASGVRNFVSFGQVSLNMTAASIEFEGAAHQITALLAIDQHNGRLGELDSLLSMTSELPPVDLHAPIQTQFRLVCSRTR